jgi:RNA polymerase sigma-70 factor (ECF subfamily)
VASFESASDPVVVAAARDDPEAFAELFRRYRRVVVLYVARRCDSAADVDDVVAETFLGALAAAHRYDPRRGEVRPWLLGIAHNQLGLLWRSQRRQQGIALAVRHETELSEEASARLLEQMAAAQDGAEIWRALRRLPDDQREALLLVTRDELSPKEAAAVIGVTAATFRVRLFRARHAMQALLAPAGSGHQGNWAHPKEVEK